MMFLWLFIIGLVVYLIFSKRGRAVNHSIQSGETPEDVLTMRFVNGEITEEEYKKIQKIIHE